MTLDDLRALGYTVNPADDNTSIVCGYGLQTYIRNDDDEALAALLNPEADLLRKFQFNHPEEALALEEIRSRTEFTVTQPDPNTLEWEIKGPNGFDEAVALTDLLSVVAQIKQIPRPPDVATRIAYALAADTTNDPAAIKAAIIQAIASAG